MVTVSVVIPCYNQGQYVDEAVDSILRQTFQNVEILIINDGSTDAATNAKLRAYQRPFTRVLETPNQGLPAARNHGIRLAQGKYILPLDADDYFAPTYLEQAVAVLDAQADVGVVTCGMQFFGLNQRRIMPQGGDAANFLVENNAAVASLCRKICWEQAGGYNITFTQGYEDWNFWLDVTKRGWRVAVIPEYLFYYRRRPGSMLAHSDAMKPKLIRQLVENHRELFAAHVADVLFAKEQQLAAFKQEKQAIQRMPEYRVGRLLLRPLRLAQRLCDWRRLRRTGKALDARYGRGWGAALVRKIKRGVQYARDAAALAHMSRGLRDVRPADKIRLLFIMPHLECGGGEKVCLDILTQLDPQKYQLALVTTRAKPHRWRAKFRAVTPHIWHLPETATRSQIERFIGQIVQRLQLQLVLINHSRRGYEVCPFLKAQFPNLAIIDLIQGGLVPAFVHAPTTSDSGVNALIQDWQGQVKTTRDMAEYSAPFDRYLTTRLVINRDGQRHLRERYHVAPEKIHVILNGVDTAYFDPSRVVGGTYRKQYGIAAETRVVSFLGRLNPQKHPELVVALADWLRLHGETSYKFIIAGDGNDLPAIRAQIRRQGLEQTVFLPGYLEDARLLLQDTDALLLCSETEGLPLVILEAFAMGVPVVSSDVGGVAELVTPGENGYLVPFDEQFLTHSAAALRALFADREQYRAMSARNRRKAEQQFSLQQMARQYDQLFTQLVQEISGNN